MATYTITDENGLCSYYPNFTVYWFNVQGAFVLFLKCTTIAQRYISYDSAFVQGCSANCQCFGGNLIYTLLVACLMKLLYPQSDLVALGQWFPTFVAWWPGGEGSRAVWAAGWHACRCNSTCARGRQHNLRKCACMPAHCSHNSICMHAYAVPPFE